MANEIQKIEGTLICVPSINTKMTKEEFAKKYWSLNSILIMMLLFTFGENLTSELDFISERDMANNSLIMIALAEAKYAAVGYTTLEDRLRAAMQTTKGHWLLTDEDGQFKAAVGAVFVLSNEEDKDRIAKEIGQLNTLGAMFSGVQVNLESFKSIENPIGLMKMWREIKSK